MSRYSRDLVSIILALILLVGCGSGVSSPTSTVPALALTQISLSPMTASIHVGEEQTFVAQGFDQYHNPMTGITFTWTPSNDGANGNAIATFHGGVATGVSAGTMHVTASALGVTSTPAALIVLLPPPVLTSLILTPSNPTIFSTGSQQFVAAGVDQYGNSVSGMAFTFSSSDLDVATISSTGLATGVGGPNAGTSIITASAQGVSGSTTLTTVRPDAVLTMITVTPLTATVQAGNTVSFTVTGLDQFGTAMTGLTFAWVSSNPTIAAVNALNSEGKNSAIVTGVAINGGSVTLTASAQGIASPPVQLIVTKASPVLTTINVIPTNASIAVGSTQTFTVSGTDQFGAAFMLPPVQFSSENTSIATVDASGVATGVSAGTAQIIATAGSVTGQVFLTVTIPPPPPAAPPILNQLSPPLAMTGGTDLTYLTITGSNFAAGAAVNFGSNVLTPTTVTATTITVRVPANDLQTAATIQITVSNPAPAPATSAPLSFLITDNGIVSIDFDDGYQSMYDNGLPIFDKVGIRTTQYIITGNTLGDTIINPDLGAVGVGNPGFVTWNEVHMMAANGHEIGAHTRTHQALSNLCKVPACSVADSLQSEIAGSKADLMAQGFNPVTFAYPYGDYGYVAGSTKSGKIGRVTKMAGFLGARDSDTGYVGASQGHMYPFYLWSVAGEADLNTTLDNLTGYIDYAVANKLWLIFLLHRVDDNNPDNVGISISSALLQGMVDHIVQNKVNVVTNSEGLVIENLNGQTQPFAFPE
jgi:peptidoglycan/xylan/chitin deacetylase (PgdA/CDA1 family)